MKGTELAHLMAAPSEDPLYIKFDIEGAERSVLEASIDVLEARRPALAVSIYHAPLQIFGIPNMLRGLGYSVWLRNHGIDGADLVAYAASAPRLDPAPRVQPCRACGAVSGQRAR